MSENVQIALITGLVTGIPAFILACLTAYLGIVNSRKVDNVKEQTTEIKHLADGNLSKVTEDNKILTAKFEALTTQVAMMIENKKIADKVADKIAERITLTATPLP